MTRPPFALGPNVSDVLLPAEPRIEQVAEGVAHQIERQHRQHDGEPRERRDPTGST